MTPSEPRAKDATRRDARRGVVVNFSRIRSHARAGGSRAESDSVQRGFRSRDVRATSHRPARRQLREPAAAMSASRRGLERDGYAYVPPRDDGLSGQDAWDDSALMDAYNSAVERYKITHGLGAGSASGAARATLSPSVGGSRNATAASPARGGTAEPPTFARARLPGAAPAQVAPAREPRDVVARSPVGPGGERGGVLGRLLRALRRARARPAAGGLLRPVLRLRGEALLRSTSTRVVARAFIPAGVRLTARPRFRAGPATAASAVRAAAGYGGPPGSQPPPRRVRRARRVRPLLRARRGPGGRRDPGPGGR